MYMYAMQLIIRQPTLWVNNQLVLAVRYIAVANVLSFLIGLGEIEVDRSLKFSSHYTGSTKCPGNFTSLDTPLLFGLQHVMYAYMYVEC